MWKPIFLIGLLLSLVPRPGGAETLRIAEFDPPGPELLTDLFCLTFCPVIEPFAWFDGWSPMKNAFWNHIDIRTEPTGANVLIFYDRGWKGGYGSKSVDYTCIRLRGVTPIKLRPTPMAGLGKKSSFSLVIFKRGFKPIVKDFKVSGNAEYVFQLEPLDEVPDAREGKAPEGQSPTNIAPRDQ